MTRLQQRLAKSYNNAVRYGDQEQILAAQDALIGDALYRRNQSRINPIDRMIRDQGLLTTAQCARKLGIDFIDFYTCVFARMPRFI